MEYQQFDGDQIRSYFILHDQDVQDQEPDAIVGPGSLDYTSPEPKLFRLNEVDEICRICLKPGSIPIFGGDSDIKSVIKQFAGIDVTLDDGLPHNLCTQCHKLLESAITFRRLAQKSDSILRKNIDGVDNESQGRQCDSAQDGDQDSEETDLCDGENLEMSVYLEYAETENESMASDLEECNASFNDTFSISESIEATSSIPESIEATSSIPESIEQTSCIPESIEPTSNIPESIESDHEDLETLFDSFIKNARFPQCEVCNITFRTAEQLSEHTSGHDPESIVVCEVCKNIIHKKVYSIHLKLHKKSFSQRLETKYKKIACTVCEKNVSKNYMKRHMKLHGVDENNSKFKKCTVCDKDIHRNYLTEHIIRMHMQPKEPQGKSIQRVQCPICSQMYSESTYKNHVASHATSRKKFFCEECGKEFHLQSSFATHKLTHKAEYKFKCQFCPYRGKHLGLLKIHVRTHTRDYLYKCKICDSDFITKSNLTAHEKTHNAEVKFVCSECGKCFAAKRTLRNHMISVHEGIKAFSCDVCGKSYGCRQVMLTHRKRVHNLISINCTGNRASYLIDAQDNMKVEDV